MPVTACDISNGPYNGNIYVNWSDQRNGTNDTDIWICRSTDGGHTWSDPLRVNDDSPGKQQFFTWMAIDQTNGYIYIVFYDRRNYEDNRTDVYLALSSDGGQTFSNHKISETPFTPTAGIFFGDYINIAAHNNVIRPIWTRMDQNNLSLWTAIVEPGLFTDVREINQIIKYDNTDNLKVHPNPFNSQAIINYHLEDDETVVIKVCDVLGKEIELLFVGHQTKGDHQAVWNAENMPSGVYIVRMVFNGITKSKKVILTK